MIEKPRTTISSLTTNSALRLLDEVYSCQFVNCSSVTPRWWDAGYHYPALVMFLDKNNIVAVPKF